MKGRRNVQLQFERAFFYYAEGGNVLILRGMEVVEDAHHVEHRADVDAVGAATGGTRIAHLREQIGGIAGRPVRDHRLAVTIVEHQLFGIFDEAGGLLLGGFVKALLIEPEKYLA